MNPDPDHFVLEFIEPWITEEGIANRKLSGKLRYFVYDDGQLVTSWCKEDLLKRFPKKKPRTYTFVPSLLQDNPKMLESNPDYADELDSNSKAERAALLEGNWKVREEGSQYFKREWLTEVDRKPDGCVSVRAWDKASTEPSDKNRYPDYTACSPLISKDKHGIYYLEWLVHDDIKDKGLDATGRFRKRAGERDKLIEKQARFDGDEAHVIFAIDPGAAGIVEFQESSKKLLEEGFVVRKDPMPPNRSKLVRFIPFAAAAENGLVRIVSNTFPNKATQEAFFGELESFDGERSSSHRKDDWSDATASAFNFLAKSRVLRPFDMNGHTGGDSQTYKTDVLAKPIPNI